MARSAPPPHPEIVEGRDARFALRAPQREGARQGPVALTRSKEPRCGLLAQLHCEVGANGARLSAERLVGND